jgi:hypothetical protein
MGDSSKTAGNSLRQYSSCGKKSLLGSSQTRRCLCAHYSSDKEEARIPIMARALTSAYAKGRIYVCIRIYRLLLGSLVKRGESTYGLRLLCQRHDPFGMGSMRAHRAAELLVCGDEK